MGKSTCSCSLRINVWLIVTHCHLIIIDLTSYSLWGHPSHLAYISKALRVKHSVSNLQILVVKRNKGYSTYDGIEIGGERVAQEVEVELERLECNGHSIKRLSFVGYSLGGLVSRYAVGLLYAKGWFDKLEPVVSSLTFLDAIFSTS